MCRVSTEVQNDGLTALGGFPYAEDVLDEFENCIPVGLEADAIHCMLHALLAPAAQSAQVGGGVHVSVTYKDGALQEFAPCVFFGRVREGGAERAPYAGEGDRSVGAQPFFPRFLAVGPLAVYDRLGEKEC